MRLCSRTRSRFQSDEFANDHPRGSLGRVPASARVGIVEADGPAGGIVTTAADLIDMTVDYSNTMHDYFTKVEVLAELAEQDRYQAGSWLIISG